MEEERQDRKKNAPNKNVSCGVFRGKGEEGFVEPLKDMDLF